RNALTTYSLPTSVKSTDEQAQQLDRPRVPERELFRPWWSDPSLAPPPVARRFDQIRTMQTPLSTRKLDKRPRRNRLCSIAKAGALWFAKISCVGIIDQQRSSTTRNRND